MTTEARITLFMEIDMNLKNSLLLIVIVASLGFQSSNPVQAASHMEAPLLAFDTVEFGGSRPLFDADGGLLAVDRVHFSVVTADGIEFAGRGDLTVSGQDPGTNHPAMIGTIDNIIGFTGNITDGTSKTFTGLAHVALHSISADEQRFAATGDLWLEVQQMETAPTREFEIEANLLQGSDGRWSARFSGEDSEGARIDGLFVPVDTSGVWDDTDILHLLGDVEALEFLPPEKDQNSFEDKKDEEEIYFSSYWTPGSLKGEAFSATKAEAAYWRMAINQMPPPSATDDGHFTATLVLPFSDNKVNHQHGSLNFQVDEMIVSQSQRAPDGTVSGRAEFLFSGVGTRDGVAVQVSGMAEFHLQGVEYQDGDDLWFMSSGSLRILNGVLEDAATGGAELFEDISGDLGQATLVGAINPLGQVNLTGGLGQLTLDP